MAQSIKDLNPDQRIFITGATGFLGSYILRYLIKKGYKKIIALKRESSSLALLSEESNKVKWIEGDVLDVTLMHETLQEGDWVFHCAAIVSFVPREKAMMMAINVEGTANIVNACIDKKAGKLMYVSSVSALGKLKNGQPTDENVIWEKTKATSNYSISKYLAEMEVRRGIAEGLNATIFNPSIILGAGQWRNRSSSALISLVYKGLPQFPPGSTGFVDVRDVASFIIQVAAENHAGKSYLLNAENKSFKDVFSTIAENLNISAPKRSFPLWFVKIVARFEKIRSQITGSAPLISKETIQSAFGHIAYDNSRSLSIKDFQYREINTSLRETCALFLESKEDGKTFAVFEL